MSLISWNCQGLSLTLTKSSLRYFKSTLDPSIVFLMETKNKEFMVENLRKKMDFNNGLRVDPKGLAGLSSGLVLWWNDKV
ncbi:hypothetical protein M0R45_016986 [Rubus argutus]|uniref:Reverse transcriptase n=1 Tax=Rubus argutus TaxID=59490 RepID=A0AAW1XWY5_RUBAR